MQHISETTGRLLESGESDMAIGLMPQLDGSFHQQTLFYLAAIVGATDFIVTLPASLGTALDGTGMRGR